MNQLQKIMDTLAAAENRETVVPEEALYAEGSYNAPICLIGEAPGEEEEQQNRPFVGKAGDNLNRLLHSSGIMRTDCRLENVLQFRPYKNDISPYISYKTGKGGRVVTSPIFDQSVQRLKERLEKSNATVFVPLGNPALYALTGKWRITKWRGSIIPSTLLEGRKVIPTIHPAAAVGNRNYVYNYFIVYDLLRIAREMAYPDIRLMNRTLYLNPSFYEVMEYIKLCYTKPMIAVDIEVINEEVTHLSLAIAEDNVMCIPFYDNGKDYFTAAQEGAVWIALEDLLHDQTVVKVGQNLTFDATFLHRKYGICIRPIEDTMVACKTLFPDFPMGLDFIVSIYCNGEPYYKDEGKKWLKNPFRSHMEFRRYNAMDSAVVMEAFPKMMDDLKRQGNFESYVCQAAIIEPLVYIQEKGILINTEGMKEARLSTEKKIGELQRKVDEIVGYPINVGSSKQVAAYFYDELKIKPYYKTDPRTGKKHVTTDVTVLQRLAGRGYPAAPIMLDIRHQRKMLSTYYTVMLDKDDRMRCSFNPVGTVQGRPSSSESLFGTGANLLNQPAEMKKLMIPDPGYIMVNLDLSQAENRAIAYQWNVLKMISAFERGEDAHTLTASLIFGKPIDTISNEKGSTDIGFGKYSERDIGKRSNHGFDYGLGSDTFAVTNQVSQYDAKRIHSLWHAIYPEIRQGHRAVEEELRSKGYLINMLGRKRIFKVEWGHKLFRKAYNFNAQSTVADKLNREGFCFMYYSDSELLQAAELLNTIYDSILFQYPLHLGAAALASVIQIVSYNLAKPLSWKGRSFVIPTDVSIGWNAYEMKEYKTDMIYNTETFTEMLEEDFYGKNPR